MKGGIMDLKRAYDAHAYHREIGLRCYGCILFEEITTLWKENKQAWAVIEELQRRHLITQNSVRGNDRYLNQTKHIGRTHLNPDEDRGDSA